LKVGISLRDAKCSGWRTNRPEHEHGPKNVLDPGMHSGVDTCRMSAGESPKRSLRAGTLSGAAGVSTDTLRHYERLGLLQKPPRTQGGYRAYPPESLDRVLLIRNALDCGFTLKELATVLRVRDGGGSPCRDVASLAREKVNQLSAQIAQLVRLRDSLKRTVDEWDRRLEKTPKHDRAHLLESLSCTETQHADNSDGGEDENTSISRVSRTSGFGLRSKRNIVPNAQTARGV
jgi:MerR family mercuric resistance operon transcriptional regulator